MGIPPSMIGSRPATSGDFRPAAGGETLRAFLYFVILLGLLTIVGGHLGSQILTLQVLTERVRLCQNAGEEIAGRVVRLGEESNAIDSQLLRRNQEQLAEWIQARISGDDFIRHVEVLDPSGARVMFVPGGRVGRRDTAAAEGWLPFGPDDIHVPLNRHSAAVQGEVVLGISQEALQQELARLDRSLRVKLVVAGGLALGLLFVGLVYVLHLIKKNRALDQARQSAARASYVGLLASGLAHEIRNPLNAMNINLQMLEEELQSRPELAGTEHRELLDSAKSEIKRLENLVNNFLTYARPAQPRFERRDMNLLVREVLRFLEVDFRQSQVELVEDLEPLLPAVEVDETQFKQALINLLVNARQVLKTGGRVVVRTRAGPSGDVILEVHDTGPGIPAEARERIFEVFYSSRGGGTGLGLPIAKQVVERHGGSIELESVEGEGATFRIRLPRRQPRRAAPAVAGRSEA